ncbi:MAG: hypothetical protein AAGJ35_08450 [Myxococcota bacterium]
MQFEREKIEIQTKQMVGAWINQNLLDIRATASGRLCAQVEDLIMTYKRSFDDLQDQAERLLYEEGLSKDLSLQKAVKALAEKQHFPIDEKALDHLNKNIEELLWYSEWVEEIYADPYQMIACNTPFLKAMAKRRVL